MAAVRGLCTSSFASTSQADASRRDASTSHSSSLRSSRLCSSSSTRGNDLHINAKSAARRPASRICRLVLFAVVVDTQLPAQVKSKSSSKSNTERVDSLLLEDFETRFLQNACPPSKKKLPVLGLTDTDLKSTFEQRLWVAFGATAVTAMMTKAFSACNSVEDLFQVGAGVFAAWVFSDLGTGFYHWGVDNYGDATTPFFGAQIDAFQGHHQRPWTITKREFANNVHAIARPAGFFLFPFLLLPSDPLGDSFLAIFLAMVVLSQHFHALSHMKKSQLSPVIVALQDRGVILGRKMHGMHHRPPYDVNYCIGSGLWNSVLNEVGIFKRMERVIYSKWGVAPRAWSETSNEWLQSDTYFEDGTEFDPSQSS